MISASRDHILRIPEGISEQLRILFIAKHAHWQGDLHPEDGSHAIYHKEIKEILENLNIRLSLADSYAALFDKPDVDFVFPLLNRGGFLNSEILLPLLCTRQKIPFLGASPILRGVSDDKHLTKVLAVSRGVPTQPWAIYRRGQPLDETLLPEADRFVIKPNASSASWGVSAGTNWFQVREAVFKLHEEGHDAIVEPFLPGDDIEVSIITRGGELLILPTIIVKQQDPESLRSYQEKRNLSGEQHYRIRLFEDEQIIPIIERYARNMMKEFSPFDYGRFEMRLHRETGDLRFLEVNLNCNLWSKKTISMAAQSIGWTHADLIETILCESLHRHGLIRVPACLTH